MTGSGNLRNKSKATLDVYLKQKDKNMTEAYLETHPNASRATAQARGSELLNSPAGLVYTQKIENKAKSTIAKLLDSEKDDIRLRAAQDIVDRNQGKAIQRTMTNSNGISLQLNLSGATVNIEAVEQK